MSQNQHQEAQQVYANLLLAKKELDEATLMASKVNREALGKNEQRLMAFAGSVLQGLRDTNFLMIAQATHILIRDQAVAQVVGWQSVEILRQRNQLLELGVSKDMAEELISLKSSATLPIQTTTIDFVPEASTKERFPRSQRRKIRALLRKSFKSDHGGALVSVLDGLSTRASPINLDREILPTMPFDPSPPHTNSCVKADVHRGRAGILYSP